MARSSKPVKEIILLSLVVLGLVAITLFWASDSNKTKVDETAKEWTVVVTPTKQTFAKSEFIRLKVYLDNNSDTDWPTGWGTCGQVTDVFVDGASIYPNKSRFICDIGTPDLAPGETTKEQVFEIDPTQYDIGDHTVEVSVDGATSQKIAFALTDAMPVTNCYEYTKDVHMLCKPIVIQAADFASKPRRQWMCDFIKKTYFRNKNLLHPIPSMSTVGCMNDKRIITYVMNVPPEDYENWIYTVKKTASHRNILEDATYHTGNVWNNSGNLR